MVSNVTSQKYFRSRYEKRNSQREAKKGAQTPAIGNRQQAAW
jgi:hypothetical protein